MLHPHAPQHCASVEQLTVLYGMISLTLGFTHRKADNNRVAVGVNDGERSAAALQGIVRKRITYRADRALKGGQALKVPLDRSGKRNEKRLDSVLGELWTRADHRVSPTRWSYPEVKCAFGRRLSMS